MQPTTRDTVRAAARRPSFLLGTFAVLLLSAAAAVAPPALAQSDNFNDGNADGWTPYSPLGGFGAPGTFTFPNGGYRIQAPASPAPSQIGPGRAGGFLDVPSYATFRVAVDLVDWNNGLDQAFGILARTSQLGLGTTDGYALTYATQPDGGSTIDLSRILNEEVPAGGGLASAPVALNPTLDYRLVFEGVGPTLTGRVYALTDLNTPLATVTANDTNYIFGINGLFVFDNTGGGGTADATFDNFFATDAVPEPTGALLLLLALPACRRRRRARRGRMPGQLNTPRRSAPSAAARSGRTRSPASGTGSSSTCSC